MIERAMIDASSRVMAAVETQLPSAEMRSEDVSGWAKLVGNKKGGDSNDSAYSKWDAIGGLNDVKSTLQR